MIHEKSEWGKIIKKAWPSSACNRKREHNRPDGNIAGAAHGADMGRRRFYCAFCNASHWRSSFHALHAADWFCPANHFLAGSRRFGVSPGWVLVAAVGLGISCWILERHGRAGLLPRRLA